MDRITEIEQRLLRALDKPLTGYRKHADLETIRRGNYTDEVEIILKASEPKDLEWIYKLASKIAKDKGIEWYHAYNKRNDFLSELKSLYENIAYPDKYKNLLLSNINKIDMENKQQTNTPATETQKPIQLIWWKGSNRKLKYLMDELARLDLIDRDSPINKFIIEHFIDKDQKRFSSSIAQNSSGMGSNKGTSKNTKAKPKGHEEIDNIIKSTKDLKD